MCTAKAVHGYTTLQGYHRMCNEIRQMEEPGRESPENGHKTLSFPDAEVSW